MPTVTGISRVKKGESRKQAGSGQQARVTLELDHVPYLTCSDSIVAEFLLYSGKEITADELSRLEGRVVENDALSFCHATIARRALTEHELVGKLRARELSERVIEHSIVRCREIGLVNDEQYAASFVRGRLRRGHGAHRMRHDLSQRGIDKAIVEEVLASQAGGDAMVANATEALRKKFRDPDFSDSTQRAKAQRFLLGRGYTYEQVGAALRNAEQ